ncbi:hypothetical protein SLA2020_500160 [Shorea laevis]
MSPLSLLSLSFLLLLPSFLLVSSSQPPKGVLIDCGANVGSVIGGREWLPDGDFVSAGVARNLTVPVLVPTLSTVRTFPFRNNVGRKFCYDVRVYRGARYMVRTTYFYGEVNGSSSPPVFDQIVDGTLWGVVNTTEDYRKGNASYYEGVFKAKGKSMSVCLGVNSDTDSDPFISALEFVMLEESLYNTTKFDVNGLSLVARHSFGYRGSTIRYPDDPFDRFWEQYGENNYVIVSDSTPPVSGFWNLPPSKVFKTALSTDQPQSLELRWPPVSLQNASYYIALYFADTESRPNSTILGININDVTYYRNLNVTPAGAAVFATSWPLFGNTKIILIPTSNSEISPLINAGEIFQVLELGGRTLTKDVIALEEIKKSLKNPPLDWNGDPCLPRQYRWTGVTCSEGSRIRVTTLNLTGLGLSGSVSPKIGNLTALTDIWLGNNRLSGKIPDLSSLKMLEKLHLEDNKLSGEIPSSLGDNQKLHEIFLQNNNLTGHIPDSLIGRPGLNLTTSPGNPFLSR